MKQGAFLVLILLVLSACTAIMTPTPLAMVVTQTPQLTTATATLIPTSTPTQISTVTSTPTETATPTATPKPTEIPLTPIPNREVYFRIDPGSLFTSNKINSGIPQDRLFWISQALPNVTSSYVEVVDGQQFGFEGKVVHAVISGPPPVEAGKMGGAHRPNIDATNPSDIVGNWAWEFSHIVRTEENLTNQSGGYDSWMSLASVGVPVPGDDYNIVGGVKLITEGKAYPYPYLEVYMVDGNNKSHPVPRDNPPKFDIGKKHRFRIEVFRESEGKPWLRVFIDSVFVGKTEITRLKPSDPLKVNVWEGAYAGAKVQRAEVIQGEGVIFKLP